MKCNVLVVLSICLAGCACDPYAIGYFPDVTDKIDILWTVDVGHPVLAQLNINGRYLYTEDTYGVAKIDLENGNKVMSGSLPESMREVVYRSIVGQAKRIGDKVVRCYYESSEDGPRYIAVFREDDGTYLGCIRMPLSDSPGFGRIFGYQNQIYWMTRSNSAFVGIEDLAQLCATAPNAEGFWDVSVGSGLTVELVFRYPGYETTETIITTEILDSDELGLSFLGVFTQDQDFGSNNQIPGKLFAMKHTDHFEVAWSLDTDMGIPSEEFLLQDGLLKLTKNKYFIEPLTGRVAKRIPNPRIYILTNAVWFSGKYFFAAMGNAEYSAEDGDKQVACWNTDTEQKVWEADVGAWTIDTIPIEHNGVLYVTDTTQMFLFDAMTGRPLGQTAMQGNCVLSGPFLYGEDVMIVDGGSKLTAVRLNFDQKR